MKINRSSILRIHGRRLSGLLLLVPATFILFQVPLAAQQYYPPLAGLVGWWKGDGNGNDSASTNNGTVTSNVSFVPGVFGQAFNFPGLYPGVVQVPDCDAFKLTNSLSISAWINMQGNSWIVLNRGDNYSLNFDNAGHLQFGIGPGGAVLLPTNAVPQNQWTHVAGTLDGATGDMRAYINGVLVAQSNTTLRSAAAIVSGYGIGIGASFDNSASFSFHGFVDEVLLYSRALSASDVASLAVTNNSCIPHGATATATLVYGFVVAINLTDSGCGYTNPPLVQINGGGGANATAFATISNGAVTSITVTDAGFGYTSMPEVVIAPPPFIPWLEIAVSQVGVTAHVVLGQTYILETSGDLVHWTQVGDPFTAQANTIREVFDVDATNRFFRVAEVR